MPPVIEKGEKLLWKCIKTCYFVFFPWSNIFLPNWHKWNKKKSKFYLAATLSRKRRTQYWHQSGQEGRVRNWACWLVAPCWYISCCGHAHFETKPEYNTLITLIVYKWIINYENSYFCPQSFTTALSFLLAQKLWVLLLNFKNRVSNSFTK